jgi:uncharacterized protein
MSIDPRLLELLVCPICKGPVTAVRRDGRLHALACHADRLSFPVRDGMPWMLESEASPYDAEAQAAGVPTAL